jgi:hypothetical protein
MSWLWQENSGGIFCSFARKVFILILERGSIHAGVVFQAHAQLGWVYWSGRKIMAGIGGTASGVGIETLPVFVWVLATW